MANPSPSRLALLAALGFGFLAKTGAAQVMLSPTAVLGTDLGTFDETVPLEHMIDHSGVEVPFVSGTTPFDTYFADPTQTFATNGPSNNWQSPTFVGQQPQGYVDFDLGASHQINKLAIWNVALKQVTVRIAETPEALETGTIAGNSTLTDHLSFSFSYPVDVLSFGRFVQGRYVRLVIGSVYPIVPGQNFYAAIAGEVVASVAGQEAPELTIKLESNGDVTVTFTGTLLAAPKVDGTYDPVPGNPSGTYRIPKGSLQAQQCFRAVSN